jgi:hypothetical protein
MARKVRARPARAKKRRTSPAKPRRARRVRPRAAAPARRTSRAANVQRRVRSIRRNPKGWWQTPTAMAAGSAVGGVGVGVAVYESMALLREKYSWIPTGLPDWVVQVIAAIIGVMLVRKFSTGQLRTNGTAALIGFGLAPFGIEVSSRARGMITGEEVSTTLRSTDGRLPPGVRAGGYAANQQTKTAQQVRARVQAIRNKTQTPNGVKLVS